MIGLWRRILKGMATRITADVKRIIITQCHPTLRLRHEATDHISVSRVRVNHLNDARARNALTDTQCHALHHKTKPRISRCALRLPQQPRGCPLPRPRHRAQNLAQLHGGVLGKGLLRFILEMVFGNPWGQRPLKFIGIQTQDIHRIGADEIDIKLICRTAPMNLGQMFDQVVIHPDIQHRARPAPIRSLAAGAHRNQGMRAKLGPKRGQIRNHPLRDLANRVKGQGRCQRHGQTQAHQTLQAFGAIAMGGCVHIRRGGDQHIVGAIFHLQFLLLAETGQDTKIQS